MSGAAKVFLIIILSVIVGVGFYYFTVIPKKNDLITKTQKLNQLKKQLEILKVSTSKLAEWEKAKAQYQRLLAKMQEKRKGKITANINVLTNYLRALEDLLYSYVSIDPQISISSISTSKKRTGSSNSLSTTFHFKAHLATILRFLSDMSDLKLRNVVSVESISLNPVGKISKESGNLYRLLYNSKSGKNFYDPLLDVKMVLKLKMYGGGGE